MDWRAAFSREHQPQPAEMEAFINSPHWQALRSYIEDTYKIQPLYDYSTCSMQEGWSIRYRKGVRAICSMYPMEGYSGDRRGDDPCLLRAPCAGTPQEKKRLF